MICAQGGRAFFASATLPPFVGSLVAVGAFVLGVFDYLVDAFVGIDVTSLSAEFVGCAVLFVRIRRLRGAVRADARRFLSRQHDAHGMTFTMRTE